MLPPSRNLEGSTFFDPARQGDAKLDHNVKFAAKNYKLKSTAVFLNLLYFGTGTVYDKHTFLHT
jgi:hypothetical protein